LPSGPDPVGEWLVHRQPPAPYIGPPRGEGKRAGRGVNIDLAVSAGVNAASTRRLGNPMPAFALDPRLAADSSPLGALKLCQVLLFNDVRFPWLILVPARADLVEVIDLDAGGQQLLMQEVALIAEALKSVTGCHKLNVAALG